MNNLLVLIFFLFALQEIIPQQANYFPISIGNEYQYHDFYGNFDFFRVDKDSVFPNGKYYIDFLYGFGYCRKDSLGNIYSASKPFFVGFNSKPDEYLLFKANAQVGDVWPVAWDFNPVIDTGYAQCIYADTGYLFGKYRKIKGVRIFDASYNYYYFYMAEDIGLDEDNAGEQTTGSKLNYAKINNVIYGTLVGIKDKFTDNTIPGDLKLNIYPNPFNNSAKIYFSLPKASNIELKIYNILGEKLYEITRGKYNAGEHQISFNSSGFGSGIYILLLSTDSQILSKKMIILK